MRTLIVSGAAALGLSVLAPVAHAEPPGNPVDPVPCQIMRSNSGPCAQPGDGGPDGSTESVSPMPEDPIGDQDEPDPGYCYITPYLMVLC